MQEWIATPAGKPGEGWTISEKELCKAQLDPIAAQAAGFGVPGTAYRCAGQRRAETASEDGAGNHAQGSAANKPFAYGGLARFLRAVVRPCLRRWDTSGARCAEAPAVYVAHHRNLSGPVHALALLPDMPRPWVLHQFLEKKECFEQYYGFTFRKRFGWPQFLAWPAAAALSCVVPAVLRSFGAIPVYRGLHKARGMMDETVAALLRGENILLCPDVDYDSSDDATGEIYKGFLQLEKLYHEKTGGHVRFVPVFCGHSKCILTGEPVCFADGASFRAQRDEVARQLIDSLNALAAECGKP